MRGAADRCQRIGACRKSGSGVMCPSYMATREEEHATRGRANALVKALSEPDPRARDGRRAPARDPRPLPRVQGVQERVPARRRHGLAEGRVPLAPPGHPRRAAALAAVRRDPPAQPARRGHRAAVEPAGAGAGRPGAARAHDGDRAPSGRCRASRASTSCAGTAGARRRATAPPRAATSSSSPTRSRPTPSRRSAARRSSCSRPPAIACGWRARAAAGARASPRGCSTRRAGRRRTWPRGSRPTPSAACRSWAASRRAC